MPGLRLARAVLGSVTHQRRGVVQIVLFHAGCYFAQARFHAVVLDEVHGASETEPQPCRLVVRSSHTCVSFRRLTFSKFIPRRMAKADAIHAQIGVFSKTFLEIDWELSSATSGPPRKRI